MDGSLIAAGAGGFAAGALIAFLWADRTSRQMLSDARTAQALAQQRAASLEADVQKAIFAGDEKLSAAAAELSRQRAESESLRQQLSETQVSLATARSALESSRANVDEQKKILDEANEKLTKAFADVSLSTLAKNNEAFLSMAETRFRALSTDASGSLDTRKAQIETLVKPLEEMLAAYQTRLAEIETSRNTAYADLRQQIGQMAAVQTALSAQTTQLVGALTRPNVRGQWGEIALRRLVELAGMTERCDFLEQPSVDTEEGRLRPDMVVQLPANRSVIIDCKAVLGAFLDAASAKDDADRDKALGRHAQLIRARAKELSSKQYWSQFTESPEFVVLFLPGESFLYAAAERDTALIEDSLAQRVIIATPTTLIALLKSIEYGWRQEKISQNAEEIRTLGVEIYDRLAVVATYMDKLGRGLDGVVAHYNNAVKSLEARLLVSARKMGELGAKNEKEIAPIETVDRKSQIISNLLWPENR